MRQVSTNDEQHRCLNSGGWLSHVRTNLLGPFHEIIQITCSVSVAPAEINLCLNRLSLDKKKAIKCDTWSSPLCPFWVLSAGWGYLHSRHQNFLLARSTMMEWVVPRSAKAHHSDLNKRLTLVDMMSVKLWSGLMRKIPTTWIGMSSPAQS